MFTLISSGVWAAVIALPYPDYPSHFIMPEADEGQVFDPIRTETCLVAKTLSLKGRVRDRARSG